MKFLFILFITISCLASEPKFHYGDCAEVIHGFYTGCKGVVEAYYPNTSEYQVSLNSCKNNASPELYIDAKESDLKPVRGCQ